MKFKVLIIGLGQIGLDYDYLYPFNSKILSYSRAFFESKYFDLVGAVDKKKNQRIKFLRKYKLPAYFSLSKALDIHQPEFVIISTPTQHHYKNILVVLSKIRPKMILCEKPLAYNYDEAKKIVSICKKYNVKLLVNYLKNVEVGTNKLINMFKEKKLLQPFQGINWYSKGLYNNGSHSINLLIKIFGEPTKVKIINKNNLVNSNDIQPDFILSFRKCEIIFKALDERNFSNNSLELYCANGKVNYLNDGNIIQVFKLKNDLLYKNYKILDYKAKIINTDYTKIMKLVVNECKSTFENSCSKLPSGLEALKTSKILEEINLLRRISNK